MEENRIAKILIKHFEGNKRLAGIAFALFVAGWVVFVTNNTVLFFVDEEAYFWPRLCMKAVTDLTWMAGALIGTHYYPTKRNRLLMPTLGFYILGDIAVFFSIPVGGIFYGAGHVFLLWAIIETTYIRRWQRVVLIASFAIPVVVMIRLYGSQPLLAAAGIIYGGVIISVMALSLSNRFFWLAGIVFTLSDLTGVFRVTLMDNKLTYVITTFIYFLAYFMLCISVYSTNRKEVVTWADLFSMLKRAEKRGVSFWVCGSWALGLVRGNKKYSYDHIDLAYDIDYLDEFLALLRSARYEKTGGSGNIRTYYSELYGELKIFPCLFNDDGSAILTTGSGNQLELDRGFFETVRVLGKYVPCIAPGGQKLLSSVLETME